MPAHNSHPEPAPKQAGPTFFLIILGIIVALLVAFLVLRPHSVAAPKQETPAQH